MFNNTKIIHHQHTGRLRPHEHTSYTSLAFIVLVATVVLTVFSFNQDVYAGHPPPQAGSVGLTGQVPGKPPSQGANITSPPDGKHFITSPITVSGSCPTQTLVEIYKNDIFAGSTPCSDSGGFSINVDLLFGQNTLTAQVYDA